MLRLILLPFLVVWRLITLIVGLTGRLLAVGLGLVFIVVGFIMTITVVGAVIGIPLILLGLMLLARGIF